MSKFTFHQGASRGDQVVTLDGEDISAAVRSLTLEVSAGDAPKVTIQPAVYEFEADRPVEAELGLTATKIYFSDETAALLKRFGWTPPVEEI